MLIFFLRVRLGTYLQQPNGLWPHQCLLNWGCLCHHKDRHPVTTLNPHLRSSWKLQWRWPHVPEEKWFKIQSAGQLQNLNVLLSWFECIFVFVFSIKALWINRNPLLCIWVHLLDLLTHGAGLDGGHVFCLVNDGFIHHWPPLLPSYVQS